MTVQYLTRDCVLHERESLLTSDRVQLQVFAAYQSLPRTDYCWYHFTFGKNDSLEIRLY